GTGVPPPGAGMVVGSVEAVGPAVDRLQQVGPPDQILDGDRGCRVDVAPKLTPSEEPNLDPDAVLRALLPPRRVGILEVQVAHDHAHRLEAEAVQHRRSYTEMPTSLVSRYSSMPWRAPSAPRPLSLT